MGSHVANLIAKRWAGASSLRHSRHIVRMGVVCIGLCICVMVVSACILTGFRQEVSEKVFGFGSHVVIQPYLTDNETNEACINWNGELQEVLDNLPGISSAQAYTLKGALVRGREQSHGVFYKGLPPNFDTSFFSSKLKRGRLPDFAHNPAFLPLDTNRFWTKLSQEVLVSELLANKLNIDTGSRLRAYFACEGRLRPRAFTVCGIYSTGLERFDETYVIGHIGHIQKLNGWNAQMSDGVDIRLENPEKRQWVAQLLQIELPYRYNSFACDALFPEIFDWLVLVDANVWVLMVIMLIVCLICLVSLLFILMIERKAHVGILMALGGTPLLVRRIFVRQTLRILGRGLLWGNAAALILCALQKITGLIRLNEAVYYIDRVPVAFPWLMILATNLLVMAAAYLLLITVSRILRRYHPHRTIKSAAL
ncbi:MAG: hypothetical protein NC048_08845 [Bacteroides sp.]|nr:hypothetical protein [Ruminococcus flavefaciens]MCM1555584.1 hypothetical protein [Bacteroides sp.]